MVEGRNHGFQILVQGWVARVGWSGNGVVSVSRCASSHHVRSEGSVGPTVAAEAVRSRRGSRSGEAGKLKGEFLRRAKKQRGEISCSGDGALHIGRRARGGGCVTSAC